MKSRNALLALLITIAIAMALSQSNYQVALYQIITNGVLLICWLIACFGWGSCLICIAKKCFHPNQPEPSDKNLLPLQIATALAFGIGIISFLTLALGLRGWINIYTVWLIIGTGIALAARRLLRLRQTQFTVSPFLLLIAPIAGFWLYMTLIPAGLLWNDEPNGYDILEYHMQIPRQWWEIGRIVPLHDNVFSFFPQNVEMQFLLASFWHHRPWQAIFLAQMMSAAMMGVAALALYGAGRMLAPRGAKWMALAFMLLPWTMLLAPICYNESGLLMFGILAVAWSLLASTSSSQAVILSGIATGFACGTKLTAGPMLLVPLFILFLLNRQWKLSILYLLSSILFLSPWLIRDLLWAHNPVFPELMPLLGHAHFSDLQVKRWEIAHHLAPGQSRLGELWKQIIAAEEFAWILLPLALISLIKPASRKLGIVLLIQFIFWIFFTHMQGRFFVLAVPIMLLMIALANFPAYAFAAISFSSCIALLLPTHQTLPGKPASRIDQAIFYAPLAGVSDYSWAMPQEVLEDKSPGFLILIGDARAFLYERGVLYRTVFDVDNTNRDLIDAWAHGQHGTFLIDPNELRRFARTYYGIPPIDDDHDKPYIVKK